MPKFKVIVGNIGTVYDGPDYTVAINTFKQYKTQSAANCGRAAGEPVSLLEDDEMLLEYDKRTGQPV